MSLWTMGDTDDDDTQTIRIQIRTRTVNSFQDVMSSASAPTLFRMSRRSGSVLIIYVCTSMLSQYMACVTNAARPKPLSSLAHPELVSAIIYTFRLTLLSLSMKERQCGYCMHYVGAVLKRNRSYGTMELTALFSLMTVSTKWLRIFKTTSLRSSCGLLSIRTRPPMASHHSSSRIAPVFSSITLLLQTSSAGNASIRMWRMSPW